MGGLLADARGRAAAARAVAGHIGVGTFLILVWDEAVTSLRPAPGFPATLPGGPSWRNLMDRCAREDGSFTHELSAAGGGTELASIFVAPDRTVVVFIGGKPRVGPLEFAEANPLLLALLKSECREAVAAGLARSAQDAHRTANALTLALDGTRRSLASGGVALKAALAEAARLNKDLQSLNATLEDRVREETAERLKAEDALRQAQKMEAIGQLTGGLAHDFNNMMAIVVGALNLLTRRLKSVDPSIQKYIDSALEGTRRATQLTQRLLAFSRQQSLSPKPADPNKLVIGMSELLRGTLGRDIVLEAVTAGGVWDVFADQGQLENAIVNVAINARDAMPNGGKLTIETQNAFLDERYAAAHLGTPAGQYVLISITDTGAGISPEIVDKVFDPFFTTKAVGKGTGLGLSQVYGFVKQSGGHIKIYSEMKKGTSIKIYLPRHTRAPADDEQSEAKVSVLSEGHQELILVVDDEEAVRNLTVDALNELGYRVLEAPEGRAALKLLNQHPAIDMLLTDVVMPEIGGRMLVEAARKIRPELKVLYMTGFTRNAVVHNGIIDAGVNLIGKPFTIEELAEKVRLVLDS